MTFIKINLSQGGISPFALCSTLASECGCTDQNGPSYEGNKHEFNRISNIKERGGKRNN